MFAITKLQIENSSAAKPFEELANYCVPKVGLNNLLSSVLIVGSQGSGKTTFTLSLIDSLIKKRKTDLDTEDCAVIHLSSEPVMNVMGYFKLDNVIKKKQIFVINDDAAAGEGQLSRRSMSKENAQVITFYIVMRHVLARNGYVGNLCVFHLTQVYTLLDKTLRANCKLRIYKDMPEDFTDRQEIIYTCGRSGYSMLMNLSRRLWSAPDAKEKVKALESGLAKFTTSPAYLLHVKKSFPGCDYYEPQMPKPED